MALVSYRPPDREPALPFLHFAVSCAQGPRTNRGEDKRALCACCSFSSHGEGEWVQGWRVSSVANDVRILGRNRHPRPRQTVSAHCCMTHSFSPFCCWVSVFWSVPPRLRHSDDMTRATSECSIRSHFFSSGALVFSPVHPSSSSLQLFYPVSFISVSDMLCIVCRMENVELLLSCT